MDSKFWTNRRVLVTGGSGFLGSHVLAALERRFCPHVSTATHEEFDLRRMADIERLFDRVGDGTATREFLYVEDAAEAILKPMKRGRRGA